MSLHKISKKIRSLKHCAYIVKLIVVHLVALFLDLSSSFLFLSNVSAINLIFSSFLRFVFSHSPSSLILLLFKGFHYHADQSSVVGNLFVKATQATELQTAVSIFIVLHVDCESDLTCLNNKSFRLKIAVSSDEPVECRHANTLATRNF
jgi:hypothetical protein